MSSRLLLLIIYLGFISLGLPDGTIGVAWPQMHATLALPIGLGGVVVLVATLLSATSGFASGRWIARFTTGPVVLVSCFLTGSALLIIARAQSFGWLIAAAAPLGLGAGAVDAGLNGYVARHYSGRHMNWLHACWGIGATTGPLVMARALSGGAGWRGGYLTLGLAQLSLALLFLATLRLWTAVPERRPAANAGNTTSTAPTTLANSPAGWLSAAIFAIYVAVETTAGVWAGSILIVARGISPETAGLCVACYYGSITAGRLAAGFVAHRCSNRTLVTLGTTLALLGALVFVATRSVPFAAGALVLLGLGFAPVYPGLMHEVPRRFAPAAVQTVIGRQSGAACLGAASLPAAAGWLAEHSLESIGGIVVAGVLLLAAAIHRLNRIT
ncbi:MAG: MFS transporter [Opitutaceae bacterium]|nr:MFS transporter [Opitutaceae bacterium]